MSSKKSNATKNGTVTPLFEEETCPTECMETNHPGIEHAEYVGLITEADRELVHPEYEEAPYHAILKVWREMLDPAKQNRHLEPTADWCAVLVARWPFLKFADCGVVQQKYFEVFDLAHELIEQVAADNPEAFEVTNREDDVENKDLYVHLLTEFQKALFVVQSTWHHTNEHAGAEMAALGEAQQQILGKQGLASYLQVISLPFTEDEQDAMNKELNEFRETLGV